MRKWSVFPVIKTSAQSVFIVAIFLALSGCATPFVLSDVGGGTIIPLGKANKAIPVAGVKWTCPDESITVGSSTVTLRKGGFLGGTLQVVGGGALRSRDDLKALQTALSDSTSVKDCAESGAPVARIVAAVSEFAPHTYAQDLDVRYGLVRTTPNYRTVDLLPGMMLRVEGNGVYDREKFFVSSRLDLDVATTIGQAPNEEDPTKLNFSTDLAAPLSRLGLAVEHSVGEDQVIEDLTGVGDLSRPIGNNDANTPTFRYWRLLYPNKLARNTSLDTKHQTSKRILLVGSREVKHLDELTKAAVDNGDELLWRGQCDKPNTYTACFTFWNRAIPMAMIRITVNDAEQWVPVGTVLGDVLRSRIGTVPTSVIDFALTEMSADDRAAFETERARETLRALRLERLFSTRYVQLKMSRSGRDSASELRTLLMLPLVSGDIISW